MFDTRLAYQIVDWERRMQIENEKKGSPQTDKYALLPHTVEPNRKEEKPASRGILASLKAAASLTSFLS